MICIKNYDMKRVKWENEQHLRVFPKTSPCGICGFLKKKRNLQSQNKKKLKELFNKKTPGLAPLTARCAEGSAKSLTSASPDLGKTLLPESFFVLGLNWIQNIFFTKNV